MRAAFYDEKGMLLAGNDMPAARAAMEKVTASGEPEFSINGGTALAAQRATGPSGHGYVFVAEMPRGPFGAFRPSGRIQLLRLVLAILISGAICYLLTRSLTAPILRLRGAATQLATGDLTARADALVSKRRDEIGDLGRDFNSMAGRIEDLITSERQLIRDISHELRSPLARLNVALGLARRRSSEETAPALDRIEQEAETLNEMIGRLLALAKMDAASEPPEPVRLELHSLLKEIVSDAAYEAQGGGGNVQIVSTTECCIVGSPELLRSAVENVVRNAVRYSPSGQPIEVRLTCESEGNGRRARISVRDHGPGVPESELENLFRPFYRVADARERDTGGIGLGLAIAYRAARLHKGSVTARNAPGGGLLVTMSLPAC
jgi:two-component system sensor histidine kinase CpxA